MTTGRPSDPAQIILLTLAINYVSEVREERYACVVQHMYFEHPQGVDTTFGDSKTQGRYKNVGKGSSTQRHSRSNSPYGCACFSLPHAHTFRGPPVLGNHKCWKSAASI